MSVQHQQRQKPDTLWNSIKHKKCLLGLACTYDHDGHKKVLQNTPASDAGFLNATGWLRRRVTSGQACSALSWANLAYGNKFHNNLLLVPFLSVRVWCGAVFQCADLSDSLSFFFLYIFELNFAVSHCTNSLLIPLCNVERVT